MTRRRGNSISLYSLESPLVPGPIRRGHRDACAGSSARTGNERAQANGAPSRVNSWCLSGGSRAQIQGREATSVICLFQHGGPARWTCSTPSPSSRGTRQAVSRTARGPLRHPGGQIAGLAVWFRPYGSRNGSLAELLPHTAQIVDDIDAGAVDDDRVGRSRGGLALDSHRQSSSRAGRAGVLGPVRLGTMRNRTCRPTSYFRTPAAFRWTGRTTGRPVFSPRSTRGRRSAPRATPVLHLATPADVDRRSSPISSTSWRRSTRPTSAAPSRRSRARSRTANYELAARMQTAVPEVLDLSNESQSTREACTASTIPRRRSTANAACSPAGSSSAACGSCSYF